MSNPGRHTRYALLLFSGGLLLVVAELFGDDGGSGWLDRATQAAIQRMENGPSQDAGGRGELPHRVIAVGTSSAWTGNDDSAHASTGDFDGRTGSFSSDADLIDPAEGFDPSPTRNDPAAPSEAVENVAADVGEVVN